MQFFQQTVPEQKPRSTKASNMPSKTELTMEEVAYHDDDAKFLKEIKKTLEKHEKSWEDFFSTLGEQVWNVPNSVPMMNIQRELKFAEGLYDEVSTADNFSSTNSVHAASANRLYIKTISMQFKI